MGDVPVGAVPAPVAVAATPALPTMSARAAKVAAASAGLAKMHAEAAATVEAAPVASAKPAAIETLVDPVAPKADEKPTLETKPVEPSDDEVLDPKTTKGLAAVEKQAKKFREEQTRAKAELEVERAEIARLRAEAQGKLTGAEEWKKLSIQEKIDRLAIENEDDYDVLARTAYSRTKQGKADPRTKAVAEQSAKERELAQTVAELKEKIEELGGEFTKRDKQAQVTAFVTKWQDDAVKAIPAEPTLIGKLYAKAPEKARAILLQVGQALENQNDGEVPSHAEVIATYEKLRRAELEEQDIDVDAMLKPAAAAPAAKTPSKTLDLGAPSTGTRPINTSPSRADKLAAALPGLKKLLSDQP